MERVSLHQTLCGLRDYVKRERDRALSAYLVNSRACDEDRLLDEYLVLDKLLDSLNAQCIEHSTDD